MAAHTGDLQSRMRMGLRSSRDWHVSHSSSFLLSKYASSALWYSLRQTGQPMELISRLMPSSSKKSNTCRASEMISASAAGEGLPMHSTPNWWNSRSLPAWGFS